ncbi:MAG: hypothetical protein GF401_09985 [Chitinivibrionales bacterium]|nr:hypothetical protein [Chitinivibrionales bacterium]
MKLRKEEIQRKVLHLIFGIVIPAGIFYIPNYAAEASWVPGGIKPEYYPVLILAFFTFLFLGGEILRFRVAFMKGVVNKMFGSMMRPDEERKFSGATYICMSSLLCSIIFINRPHIAAMALWLFIWGDAAAALVGISMGKIKIGKKSLEGSVACFICCGILLMAVFPHMPGLLSAWSGTISLPLALITAAAITVMELFPITIKNFEINDNLTVPVITGFLMAWLNPFLG